MNCLSCLCLGGKRSNKVIKLSSAARKELHRIEKKITDLFLHNAKIELFIVNSKEEIIYHTDQATLTTGAVDYETLVHYTQYLKSSVIQFSRNINNDKTASYYSTHIKGSQTIFSLYTLEIGYDVAFYTRLPSELHVFNINLAEIDYNMMNIITDITNAIDYLNNE